jgi:ADP-ribose pyrophosphatase
MNEPHLPRSPAKEPASPENHGVLPVVAGLARRKPSITTVSTREVYRNRWTSVREDIIERSNGERGLYGVVDKDPATIIIPIEHTPEGDYLWLVAQYRYTVSGWFYEFPQGGWERADVDLEELAQAELREETGLRAARLTKLAQLWIAYGVLRQEHHVFLAEEFSQGETDRDPEEHDLEVHRVPVAEFEQMLLDGRVMDNCTAAAWGVYMVWKRQTAEQGTGK